MLDVSLVPSCIGRQLLLFNPGIQYQCPGYDPIPARTPISCFVTTDEKVGQNLNYDEVVVYREEAALPTYLVAYSFF